jgi:acyl-CoA thioester hydrolase
MADYHFQHPIEVRYGDLDPQGHVNNAKYLTYFEQARVYYFIELGLFARDQSFMEIGVIIADIHITYHAPAHYDDRIQIGVRTAKIGTRSMTVEQNVVNRETGEVLATGTVILVAFDYSEHKTMPVPGDWRRVITEYEGSLI